MHSGRVYVTYVSWRGTELRAENVQDEGPKCVDTANFFLARLKPALEIVCCSQARNMI